MPARLLLAGLLAFLVLLTPAHAAPSPPATAGDRLQISLLTFGPGRVYWERFGHDAILVRDLTRGSAVAYNYGVFDFDQKNFFLNFARGRMIYRIAADPLDEDLRMYQQEGRSVTEQRLNLTGAQRQSLNAFLRWNAEPANARYHYDYFISNCATRVRDALNRALDGALAHQLKALPAPRDMTYRHEALRLISPDLWMALGMDLVLGPAADRPLNLWQASFIPMELSRVLDGVRLRNADGKTHPLVTWTRVLLSDQLPPPPSRTPDWTPAMLLIGLLGALIVVLLQQRVNAWPGNFGVAFLGLAFSLFSAFGGLVFILIWSWTDHWAGWGNHNLLLLTPLSLLLIPTWISFAGRSGTPHRFAVATGVVISISGTVALLLHGLAIPHQANWSWIALMLPLHLAFAFVLFDRYRTRART